jgi:hypothetical protein
MSAHLHRARQWTACMLSAVAVSPFALCLGSPLPQAPPSVVTGRVTREGRPVSDLTICLDVQGRHSAYGLLREDGTFNLVSMTWTDQGAQPGRYRAHLYTHQGGPDIPSKYVDPEASGIEIEIAPGWNDFRIELH